MNRQELAKLIGKKNIVDMYGSFYQYLVRKDSLITADKVNVDKIINLCKKHKIEISEDKVINILSK